MNNNLNQASKLILNYKFCKIFIYHSKFFTFRAVKMDWNQRVNPVHRGFEMGWV